MPPVPGLARTPSDVVAAHDPGSRARASALRPVALAAVTALACCVAALVLGGGRPLPVPEGLPDAGTLTGWGLRLADLGVTLAAVLTVGSLLVGSVLLPGAGGGGLQGAAHRAVRRSAAWASAWALCAVAELLLTVSETAGVPLLDLDPGAVLAADSTPQGRPLLAVVLLALVLAVGSGRVSTRRGSRVLLLVAFAALLLPVALSGHGAATADSEAATSALVVHVASAGLWVGGLAGILLHLRRTPAALAAAVPRFSVLALAAYVSLAGSGLLAAVTHLGTSRSLWTSGYAALVAVKGLVLVCLGLVGHLHRRRTLKALSSTAGGGPFLTLAGAELVLMGAALGLAAALSRTPVPPTPLTTGPGHGPGHWTLPTEVAPLTPGELALAWRPNAVVLVVLGLSLAVYLGGVQSLARAGLRWPAGRTAAFVAGLALALVDLCSGVATYAPAMVSVQVTQLLVAMLLVPALLVLAAPCTLWRRLDELRGTDGALRWVRSPAVRALTGPLGGAVLASAFLLLLYRTPLIELSLRSTWTHLLVLAVAVGAGLVVLGPLLGTGPAARPHAPREHAACLVGVVATLTLLAVQLRYGDRLLAGKWFLELRWGWVDPVQDQRLAGAVMAAAALALLGLMLVVLARGRPPASIPARVNDPRRATP